MKTFTFLPLDLFIFNTYLSVELTLIHRFIETRNIVYLTITLVYCKYMFFALALIFISRYDNKACPTVTAKQ